LELNNETNVQLQYMLGENPGIRVKFQPLHMNK